jgi:hypothetical protein
MYIIKTISKGINLARIILPIIHPWDLGRTVLLLQLSFKFPGDFKRDASLQTQRMINIHVFDLAIVGNTFCIGYKQKRFKLKLDIVSDDSILCY